MLSFPNLNNEAEIQIKNFLSELTIIGLEQKIKESAIEIRRKFALKLPDAIIAATAISRKLDLLSNDQQFSKISKLSFKQLRLK